MNPEIRTAFNEISLLVLFVILIFTKKPFVTILIFVPSMSKGENNVSYNPLLYCGTAVVDQ